MFKLKPSYFRNIIFGAEDSLVSTVGVLFGIASANVAKETVFLTGLLVIIVEALSMGAGAFLSETSENELENKIDKKEPLIGGVFMFFSYISAGIIPLVPYYLIEIKSARYLSVFLTLGALFVLGYLPQKRIKSAFRMFIVAGVAVSIGFAVGPFFKIDA